MRFYTEFPADKLRDLREMAYYPYLRFANDYMYFLTQSYSLDWVPYRLCKLFGQDEIPQPDCHRSYGIHILSSCSQNFMEAVMMIIQRSKRDYQQIYEEIAPAGAEDKLERFINHVNESLEKLFQKESSLNMCQILFRLVYVGRLAILFYKYGTKDAAYLAPFLIANALESLISSVNPRLFFSELDDFAFKIVDFYENVQNAEEFDETYFDNDVLSTENDSELESVEENSENGEELFCEEYDESTDDAEESNEHYYFVEEDYSEVTDDEESDEEIP